MVNGIWIGLHVNNKDLRAHSESRMCLRPQGRAMCHKARVPWSFPIKSVPYKIIHSFLLLLLFFLYSQSYTHWIILATMAEEPLQALRFFNNIIVVVPMMNLQQHQIVTTINDHNIEDVLHNNAHQFNAIHKSSCHHHLLLHHWLHPLLLLLLLLLLAMYHHHHPLPLMIPPLCHHLFYHQVHLM